MGPASSSSAAFGVTWRFRMPSEGASQARGCRGRARVLAGWGSGSRAGELERWRPPGGVPDTAGVVIAVERYLGEGDGDGWCRPAAADGASPLPGRMASCLAITGRLTFVWAIAGRRPSVHRTGKEAIPAPGSRRCGSSRRLVRDRVWSQPWRGAWKVGAICPGPLRCGAAGLAW
jgi:hypothetical protein